MTNNLDQFDQSPDFDDVTDGGGRRGFGANLKEAWRTRPIFKLVVLLIGLGAFVLAVISLTSSEPEQEISRVIGAPNLSEAPSGKSSPAFIDVTAKANEQRIKEAATNNDTALPTPLPSGISVDARKETDPLVEFRAEMQRQKEEQQKQIQALQQQTQQTQQIVVQQDQQLQQQIGAAMQAQMTQLATLWTPKSMQVIEGLEQKVWENKQSNLSSGSMGSSSSSGSLASRSVAYQDQDGRKKFRKPLIEAGTVSYAQMLTEANSDVPGPILAQILSGPLSGARAIGSFGVTNDLMALRFSLATLKGKEYRIEALALDPDTTLGGMATEVDHRYFARVVLPAAASFLSAFGSKLSEKPTSSVITGNGVVITTQAENGIEEGLYAGMGSAFGSMSSFFSSEANNTKVLVRVAVGTPMGLFFVSGVCDGKGPCGEEDAPARPQQASPSGQSGVTPVAANNPGGVSGGALPGPGQTQPR